MGRLLCVWEQGGHLGHLSHLRLPVELALEQGHAVYVAVRELQNVRQVLGDLPVQYLLAPSKPHTALADQRDFLSYTHLLDRQCFSSAEELQLYLQVWNSLFEVVHPDLVLFEHSPTALIAAHARPFKKINIGTGFTVPPVAVDPAGLGDAGDAGELNQASTAQAPFLPFPNVHLTPERIAGLHQADRQMLARINQAVVAVGDRPLPSLQSIFSQVDAHYLMTWPELDQFGARRGVSYLGVEPPLPRAPPHWPVAAGQKVFAYLEAFPALEALLQSLRAASACCLLFVRNLPSALRLAYSSASMRFIDEPVNLRGVASQADWVINNGGHSTVAFFANQGVAQLLIPLYQEQLFTALRVVAQGGAAMAFQDQTAYGAAVDAMGGNTQIRAKAQELAAQIGVHHKVDLRTFMQAELGRYLS